ncbi:MAG: histidinol-phosphate transaminase [Polyangiales bacterium]
MSRYWSPIVSRLHPYVPGEQPREANLVKLNTNENPYAPSPKAIAAVQAELGERLRLYPAPESDALRETIARVHGVAPENVFVGNGSDEVLAHAFHGLLRHELPVLFPDVTYSFYPTYCELYEIAYERVPVSDDFAIAADAYAKPSGGVVIANPNAPTGRALPLDEIARIVGAGERVVLVDEAYVAFGAASAVPLVKEHDNLLVVQTLSKSHALAGMRVGFAIGQPPLIEALTRVKNSFNSYPIDRLAQVAAVAALEDAKWLEETRTKIIDSRASLRAGLSALGFEVVPSLTNFVLVRHPHKPAAELAASLRAKGVLVRHFKQPRIEQYLRITVGTPAQCSTLLDALRAVL